VIEPSHQIRALARQIIARESAGRDTPLELAQGLEGAFGRLHKLTSSLVGTVGFGAVMSRAIHVTKASRPFLSTAELEVSDTLRIKGFDEIIEREGAARVTACAADLLGNVLSLLCAFIGEDLTFRLVRRIWTDLPEDDSGARSEET
jgi:hypothetical protein